MMESPEATDWKMLKRGFGALKSGLSLWGDSPLLYGLLVGRGLTGGVKWGFILE